MLLTLPIKVDIVFPGCPDRSEAPVMIAYQRIVSFFFLSWTLL